MTGLVIITPASGFVDHTAAFMMGVIGTPVVYLGVQVPQPRLRRAVGGCALSQLQRRGATVPSLHPPPRWGWGVHALDAFGVQCTTVHT